jgi:glyoxylase-like metal-dependent hydrolase (beta-lactamase superfamily II)
MPNYICVMCGNQFAESAEPPAQCLICEDERQYVNPEGQTWTTLDELEQTHHNVVRWLEPGLAEIRTKPKFGIGQRALLVQTPEGNVLWDCVSLIDKATITALEALGGVSALAMSHAHMYASMVAWSHAFGNAPIYLHAANERWVVRPDPVIEYWEDESFELDQGVTLYRCGGHFTGSMVLLWPEGAEGRGVLLSSDTLFVARDLRHVSFMYSFPNYIPLSGPAVDSIAEKVAPLQFDRIYGHFSGLMLSQDAKAAVERSVERYKKAIGS